MEKVIVKIKIKRRNSNWHDINRRPNPAPSENNRSFGISYNGSRTEPKYLHFRTFHSFSLAFNFNDTVRCFHFFSVVNSHFHRKIAVCFTCGFEFWWGAKTLRSQAKYYSHIHRCQDEVIPVVLMRFTLLRLKTDTHVCILQKDKCLHLS